MSGCCFRPKIELVLSKNWDLTKGYAATVRIPGWKATGRCTYPTWFGGFYQHSRLDKLQRLRDATMDDGEVHVNPHTGLTDQGMAIGPNGICPRMDD